MRPHGVQWRVLTRHLANFLPFFSHPHSSTRARILPRVLISNCFIQSLTHSISLTHFISLTHTSSRLRAYHWWHNFHLLTHADFKVFLLLRSVCFFLILALVCLLSALWLCKLPSFVYGSLLDMVLCLSIENFNCSQRVRPNSYETYLCNFWTFHLWFIFLHAYIDLVTANFVDIQLHSIFTLIATLAHLIALPCQFTSLIRPIVFLAKWIPILVHFEYVIGSDEYFHMPKFCPGELWYFVLILEGE